MVNEKVEHCVTTLKTRCQTLWCCIVALWYPCLWLTWCVWWVYVLFVYIIYYIFCSGGLPYQNYCYSCPRILWIRNSRLCGPELILTAVYALSTWRMSNWNSERTGHDNQINYSASTAFLLRQSDKQGRAQPDWPWGALGEKLMGRLLCGPLEQPFIQNQERERCIVSPLWFCTSPLGWLFSCFRLLLLKQPFLFSWMYQSQPAWGGTFRKSWHATVNFENVHSHAWKAMIID